jgi:hypothetical protein
LLHSSSTWALVDNEENQLQSKKLKARLLRHAIALGLDLVTRRVEDDYKRDTNSESTADSKRRDHTGQTSEI